MDLKKINLVELNTVELTTVEGGLFGPFRIGLQLSYRNWLLQNGSGSWAQQDTWA